MKRIYRYMNFLTAFGFVVLGVLIITSVIIDIKRTAQEDKAKIKRINNMDKDTLDDWWKHLHVSEKERIASKASGTCMSYPNCSFWWNGIDIEHQKAIYDHCTDRHGLLLDEWKDGKMMSE